MPDTNAARAAEIFVTWMNSATREGHLAELITAALDEAEVRGFRAGVVESAEAMEADLRDGGNVVAADKLRALLTPSPAAQPEGER
jgi:hypothetical protein